MRRRSYLLLLPALALVSTGLVPTPAAGISSSNGGTVVSVSVDPGPFTVDGLAGSAVATITVVATDPRGPIGDCAYPDFEMSWMNLISVELTRTSGGPTEYVGVDLKTHSTGVDGEHWTGKWRMGSTRGGTWTITGIWWCDGEDYHSSDPRDDGMTVTTQVVGTHAPTVSFVRVPAIAGYAARQWMVATYRDGYGHRLTGYKIAYGDDDMCGFSGSGRSTLTTDSHGRITVRLRSMLNECLYLTYPGGRPGKPGVTELRDDQILKYTWFASVTAALVPATTSVGVATKIVATISPSHVGTATLQRLVGRTWRTVASTSVPYSGHVSFAYAPTTVGPTYLRVVARPNDGNSMYLAPTPSRTLTLRGTAS